MTHKHTHEVLNQPTALDPYNVYRSDNVLCHWVDAFDGHWGMERLTQYGDACGHELIECGFQANTSKPVFHSHDRFGYRTDLIEFHPAYHTLMGTAISANMHALPWTEAQPGAHVVRAALAYMHTGADAGSSCPLTMTFASVPALRHCPSIAEQWLPKIMSTQYDPSNKPYFEKEGLTIGMAMTEKQGGSDVRANTTIAQAVGDRNGNGAEYELTGHKWFCSAPMCDAFLVLAQTSSGLSCFLMPRWKPSGEKNDFFIQRLKNKLGNISNASSEIEFRGAFAWMIGEEGRGVPTIIEMVAMTRFDCMVGSAGLMRAALAQALHHTGGRSAFGKPLHQQPLMQNVLADLCLDSEAAIAMSMRVAHALDSIDQPSEALFLRLATAIGKYWICKRTPHFTYEAMECIGGVGYVEENLLPRLYREAPVNAIWEGSGNVQCLDVLRAIAKEPKSLEVYLKELHKPEGMNHHYDTYLSSLEEQLADLEQIEYRSRGIVDQLALALQASTLLQFGDEYIAKSFINARLVASPSVNYGTLPPDTDCVTIINRSMPRV